LPDAMAQKRHLSMVSLLRVDGFKGSVWAELRAAEALDTAVRAQTGDTKEWCISSRIIAEIIYFLKRLTKILYIIILIH